MIPIATELLLATLKVAPIHFKFSNETENSTFDILMAHVKLIKIGIICRPLNQAKSLGKIYENSTQEILKLFTR